MTNKLREEKFWNPKKINEKAQAAKKNRNKNQKCFGLPFRRVHREQHESVDLVPKFHHRLMCKKSIEAIRVHLSLRLLQLIYRI